MILIVSGPSSIGKSRFIADRWLDRYRASSAPIRMAFPQDPRLEEQLGSQDDVCFHYNFLRPLWLTLAKESNKARYRQVRRASRLIRRLSGLPGPFSTGHRAFADFLLRIGAPDPNLIRWDFQYEPAWRQVMASRRKKSAFVLVSSRDEILERIERRLYDEPDLSGAFEPYKTQWWLDLTRKVDLESVYLRWFCELERLGIPFRLILSHADTFSVRPVSRLSSVLHGHARDLAE